MIGVQKFDYISPTIDGCLTARVVFTFLFTFQGYFINRKKM